MATFLSSMDERWVLDECRFSHLCENLVALLRQLLALFTPTISGASRSDKDSRTECGDSIGYSSIFNVQP
jgi:hypothetical protein